MALRDRFFGEENDVVEVESWESRNTHHITARISADNIRDAKSAFRRIIQNELKLTMDAGTQMYAEDDGYGTFNCIVIITSRERG